MPTSEPKLHQVNKLPVSFNSEVRTRACRDTKLAFCDVINLPADRVVAFAGSRLEPRPVHNLDLPAMVADETGLLQHIGDHCHGGSAHTEHLRQEFVGERDRVAVE